MNSSRTQFPENLVQHVARDLLHRSDVIQLPFKKILEISAAPLPIEALKTAYPKAQIAQWQMCEQLPKITMKQSLQKLNPFANASLSAHAWDGFAPSADAQLVLAPLVLEGWGDDTLAQLADLPSWFAPDGVLMFAILGAGAAPELVNHDPEWLTHVAHLPNIMDTGARLQALRFGLPVLDVETVRLGYTDAQTMWQDIYHISPSLRGLSEAEQITWRERMDAAFAQGVRELSLEIIYIQVWQPSAAKIDTGVRTVSLESLTDSLKNKPTFKEQV